MSVASSVGEITTTPIESDPTPSPTEALVWTRLAVSGMTCAACAARVERRLNKIDSVHAGVNYATERATVQAPARLPVETLIAAVQKAGYRAEVVPDRPASGSMRPDRIDLGRVRDLWRRLAVALLVGMPLADVSITLVLVPSLRFTGWQWVLLALTLPIVGWCALPFHRQALRAARHGGSSMDTLVSIGILTAACWSMFTVFHQSSVHQFSVHQSSVHQSSEPAHGGWGLIFQPAGSVYLDVVAAVTIFVLAGRLVEAKAKLAAGDALRALAALGAKDVTVVRADGREERIAVDQLRSEDHFLVRPGETIAADGEIVFGSSAIDRSTMTGESMPAEVAVGHSVIGGTIVRGGRLVVRATTVGPDTQLAQLVALIERAQTHKAGAQRLADRISGVFVPCVIALALLTCTVRLLIGGSVEATFSASLAVLIIACPCALGLATPTALLAATGRGAHLGIFLKGQQALESARAIDTIVLDKTGTVTTGRMSVVDTWFAAGTDIKNLLAHVAAIENLSEHSVAKAITTYARAGMGSLPPVNVAAVDEFTALAGLGARGRVDGRELLIGSAHLLASSGIVLHGPPAGWSATDLSNADQPGTSRSGTSQPGEGQPDVSQKGVSQPDVSQPDVSRARTDWVSGDQSGAACTVAYVAVDRVVVGAFAIADTIKPSATGAVAQLRSLGLRTILLTGDNQATGTAVGTQIGIDEVIAEVLPAEKATVIERLQRAGHVVAMVGDGVNDAPALARADLGMAVITGTDVALSTAAIILMRDSLDLIPTAVRLARKTKRTIRINLIWAFGYNVAALPIAACGLLNPLIAGGAMALSSLLVVSNSLRLRSSS